MNSVNKLMYQHAADIEKTQKDIKKLEKKHDEDMKRLEPRKSKSVGIKLFCKKKQNSFTLTPQVAESIT